MCMCVCVCVRASIVVVPVYYNMRIIMHINIYQELIVFETIKYERNTPKKFLENRSSTIIE